MSGAKKKETKNMLINTVSLDMFLTCCQSLKVLNDHL